AARAEVIVEREVDAFWRWLTTLDAVPTIVALRDRMETMRRRELERSLAALGPIDARQKDGVDRLTRALVNKILHAPVTALRRHRRDAAASFYVDAARRLFRLGADPEPP